MEMLNIQELIIPSLNSTDLRHVVESLGYVNLFSSTSCIIVNNTELLHWAPIEVGTCRQVTSTYFHNSIIVNASYTWKMRICAAEECINHIDASLTLYLNVLRHPFVSWPIPISLHTFFFLIGYGPFGTLGPPQAYLSPFYVNVLYPLYTPCLLPTNFCYVTRNKTIIEALCLCILRP